MGKDEELKMEIMDLEDKDLAVKLLNHNEDMKKIKEDMTDSLDLLDELSENSDKDKIKQKIRKIILDNFNDVPRKNRYFLKYLVKYLKEE